MVVRALWKVWLALLVLILQVFIVLIVFEKPLYIVYILCIVSLWFNELIILNIGVSIDFVWYSLIHYICWLIGSQLLFIEYIVHSFVEWILFEEIVCHRKYLNIYFSLWQLLLCIVFIHLWLICKCVSSNHMMNWALRELGNVLDLTGLPHFYNFLGNFGENRSMIEGVQHVV